MMNDDRAEIESEPGSGNVFADLGLEDADELFTRARLGFHVLQIIKSKNIEQQETASLLSIHQSEVSHLMNGHFSRYTADKLLDFVKRLDQEGPMAKARGGGEADLGGMERRESVPKTKPSVLAAHGADPDLRPPVRGPVWEIPPASAIKPGYHVYDEENGHWVDYPDKPPPARFFGYFQYRGYWVHYDPLGIGPAGARPGELLYHGFYAGYVRPPSRIPPYGWNPPPKPRR